MSTPSREEIKSHQHVRPFRQGRGWCRPAGSADDVLIFSRMLGYR